MILDYIDNLILPDDQREKNDYALQTLARLAGGLSWLNEEVSNVERAAREELMRQDIEMSLPGDFLNAKPLALMSCAFQWYASSVSNYVQLVGWLAYRDSQKAKEYVKRVIPNISNYRNKVAAHYAITDPHKDDDEASKTSSVITNLFYVAGRLYAGAISPKRMSGKLMKPSNVKSWSVTLVHPRLVKRYWPEGIPQAHGALMLPSGDEMRIKVSFDSPL